MANVLCISRVAFSINGTEVYWYGIIMCLAIVAAIVVAMLLCKKKNINSEIPLNIALIIVPFGILGARLFACLFDASLTLADFFNFRTGGMSIIGAILGGGLALFVYCLIKKDKKPFMYFDILCSVLILAQAIGRWGNFFNQELYGTVVEENSLFARFPFAVLIDGVYYQALFFYEFMANLIGFMILANLFIKQKNYGYVMAGYLFIYGTVRTILEPLRQQEYILMMGSVQVSRLFSVLMIIAGIVLFIWLKIRDKRRISYDKKGK